jgi:tetratricopeptide (TPR) repeat protein
MRTLQRAVATTFLALLFVMSGGAGGSGAEAADDWIEVKSAHFTVVSNAGERATRRLVWQLEQVRSATSALFSWAKPDLSKPLRVIVAKDENAMRALAPQYWEDRRAIRPASVWVTGPDQHYMVIRADVEVEQQGTINPYITAYASYIDLVLGQSIAGDLPLWFRRGFTSVLSNTIVRDDEIFIGAPIPWELQILRERPLLLLPKLLSVTRTSPEYTEATRREVYDAETWAFVHFLMFGDEGARSEKLSAFATLVNSGKEPSVAFAETLGTVESLDGPFRLYYKRTIFSYRRIKLDVSVERERFPVRPLSPADAATTRALFHAAMQRPNEARAAVAEARKTSPNCADCFVVEGLLADREDKDAEAKAAFAKAAELDSTSAYAYYRYAGLLWQQNAPKDVLSAIEKQLQKAIELNTRFAAAYAWLGEIKASLGDTEAIGLIRRAITLEPFEASHRIRAAHVLMRQGKGAEARGEAQAALQLADNDRDKAEAQSLLDSAAKLAAAKPAASIASTSVTTAPAGTPGSASTPGAAPTAGTESPALDLNALNNACQSGDNASCAKLLPTVETECAAKNARACGFAGFLYEQGRGPARDATRAATLYRQACDANDTIGCIRFSLLQASGNGVAKDPGKAQETLNGLCSGGELEACTQLAVLVAAGRTDADLVRTRELLTKACDGRHARACELLKSLPKTAK